MTDQEKIGPEEIERLTFSFYSGNVIFCYTEDHREFTEVHRVHKINLLMPFLRAVTLKLISNPNLIFENFM